MRCDRCGKDDPHFNWFQRRDAEGKLLESYAVVCWDCQRAAWRARHPAHPASVASAA